MYKVEIGFLIIMKFGSLVRVGRKRNLRPTDSDLPNLVEMAQKRRQSKRQDNVAVKSRDRSIHHLIGSVRSRDSD